MNDGDKQLLIEHYLDFYQIAYDILHDKTEVEDAVQDALADTLSHLWLKNPYAYCVKILKRKCYRRLRQGEYVLVNRIPDVREDENEKRDEEMLQRIWKYKDRLPRQTGEMMRLRFEQNYSLKEIADKMGLSMSIVHKLMNRGFEQLREMINKDLEQ